MDDPKLEQAFRLMGKALDAHDKASGDPLVQAALAKAFESTFEYVWKGFKRQADKAGLEVYSPRDAIKAAAQLRQIDDLELWNEFLNARNLSVHDYIGMNDEDMLRTVRRFRAEVERSLLD